MTNVSEEKSVIYTPSVDKGTGEEMDGETVGDATLKMKSFRTKLLFTLVLFVVYLVHGASNNVLGPSMLDLEYLTNSPTSSVAAAFTWRYGFYFTGTLLSGPIIDRVNASLITAMALLTMGLTTALMPTYRNLLGLYITNSCAGMATAINSVCAAATIIQLWGEEAKPYQHALHLSTTLGAALTPQLMKPFMGLPLLALNTSETSIYSASLGDPEQNITYLWRNVSEVSTNSEELQWISGTHILYGFLIIAVCLVALSIASFVIFLSQGCLFWKNVNQVTATNKKETLIKGKPKIVMLVLFFLQSVMYGGIEEVVGGLLLTFVVVFLGWSLDLGSNLTTLFWISITLSRVIGIILANHVRSSRLFIVQLSVILVSIVTLIFAMDSHWAVTWIGFTAIGLAGGSLFPTLINWGQECIELQGMETSVFFAGLALAKMVFPPLMGYLMEIVDPKWLLYIIFTQVVFFIICYITTVVFMNCLEKIRQRNIIHEKSPLISSRIN